MLNSLAGIIASSGGAAGGGSYESIASATGTGSSGTITFSSIPSTYVALQIRTMQRSTGTTGALTVRFNGDTGTNYAYHTLYGDTASALATGVTGATFILAGVTTTSNDAANLMGVSIIDIHSYASTTQNKTVRSLAGKDVNTTSINDNRINLNSGVWLNTAAITSVSVNLSANSFSTDSVVSLYGIKGA